MDGLRAGVILSLLLDALGDPFQAAILRLPFLSRAAKGKGEIIIHVAAIQGPETRPAHLLGQRLTIGAIVCE